ncbi:hypothetical protein Taro_027564, partial [Colocasia esculenta]|nr:hypothetical protein [Colocasia esculenta]
LSPPPPPPASSTAAGVLPSRPPPPPLLLLVLLLLLLLPLLLPLLLFLLNPIFSFKFERGLASMADEGHEEEQPQVDIGWKHGVLIDAASKRVRCNHCGKEMNAGVYRLKQHIAGIGTNVLKCKHCPRELVNEMKDYMAGRQQQRGIRIQHQQELHEEISGKGKSKAAMKGRQIPVDVEDSDETDYEDLSPNEREWREGLRQSRRAAMLESDMRRFHSTREGSSSGASVTRPPAPPIRRGGSMRGTGPTSGVDTILGRKSSSKQPSIKHAMKGMDRFKLKLDIYRDYDVKEAVTRMGPGSHWEQRFAEREALSSQIDVDELFDEEHPLNAWVETRQERDVPEFDPRDCSWAEGELNGVEAGDPELRNIREAEEKDKGMDKGDMKDNNIMQPMSGHLGSQTIVQGLLIYLHFNLPFYRTQILVAHLMEYKEDGDLGLHKNKSLVALVKQQVHTNRLVYGVQLHHNLEKAQVNNLHQEGFKWVCMI